MTATKEKTIAEEYENASIEEQLQKFEQLVQETKDIGEELNGFFLSVYQMLTDRIANGDSTPLSIPQLKAADYQVKVNSKRMAKKGIKPGQFGTLTVEEPEDEEPVEMPSIRYIRASVDAENIIFDPASGLTWVPNDAGLGENRNYIIELKTRDGVDILTNARVAGAFADGPFVKKGKAATVVVRPLFNENAEQAIHVPIEDPTFYIEPHVVAFFEQIYQASKSVPQKVLISGPQGTGKTTVIEQMSARHNRGFFRMSCGMIESPTEWFGFRDVRDKELIYVPSAFIEACESPDTDICLDEFNRLHTTLQNGLYNILDDNGEAWIDLVKRNIRVASGVVFWATANIGAAHTGTFQIDAAMEDRFAYHLKMGYLPETDEIRVLMMKTGIGKSLASTFVKVARRIRDKVADENSAVSRPLSLRQLTAVCTLVVGGMKPAQAVEFTIMPKYSEDGGSSSEQAEVRQVFQGLFAGK